MKEFMPYLPYAITLAVILLVILLIYWRKQSSEQAHKARVASIIEDKVSEAQLQHELFNVEFLDEANKGKGFTGTLQQLNNGKLTFEVLTTLPQSIKGAPICVYFRLKSGSEQNFFKFISKVESVRSQDGISAVTLLLPERLEAGQKRNFFRVSPPLEDIQALGLWLLNSRQPMPETTSNLSLPLRAYKRGIKDHPLVLEDISASGAALRTVAQTPSAPHLDIRKNDQVMMLIVYRMQKQTISFWCTGEVVNVRPAQAGGTVTYGIEFTNWAVLAAGQNTFNWAHASPVRGIPIISQWVDSLDKR